ncbi:hypothetical protein HanLR1_Chr17g0652551 [Helianthus annuus]|nr:hypothetical protein HanHA89_Chr17g0693521 [Helianthus annuus]KAJ0631306.1 hypothetical protein HanLR1_Chr17g0652551 [Helianthus annuus]
MKKPREIIKSFPRKTRPSWSTPTHHNIREMSQCYEPPRAIKNHRCTGKPPPELHHEQPAQNHMGHGCHRRNQRHRQNNALCL